MASSKPFNCAPSLMQQFLDAPGLGWLVLRIIAVFGPVVVVTAILVLTECLHSGQLQVQQWNS